MIPPCKKHNKPDCLECYIERLQQLELPTPKPVNEDQLPLPLEEDRDG